LLQARLLQGLWPHSLLLLLRLLLLRALSVQWAFWSPWMLVLLLMLLLNLLALQPVLKLRYLILAAKQLSLRLLKPMLENCPLAICLLKSGLGCLQFCSFLGATMPSYSQSTVL